MCGAWNGLDATGAGAAVGPGTAPCIAKRQTGLGTARTAGGELSGGACGRSASRTMCLLAARSASLKLAAGVCEVWGVRGCVVSF